MATIWEGKFTTVFLRAHGLTEIRIKSLSTEAQPSSESNQQQLLDAPEKAKSDVHEAVCDSFNTLLVMQVISDLISNINSVS